MTAILTLLRPLLPYAIAAAALLGLWGAHKASVALAHHAGYTEGKGEVQAAWDADKAQRKAEVDALAKAWDAERASADDAARKLVEANDERFRSLADQAHRLSPATARVRVPADALGVLDDAVRAANAAGAAAEPARPAAGSAASPAPIVETDLGSVTEWGVDVAKLYRACRDRVAAITAFYEALRASQPKPKEGP